LVKVFHGVVPFWRLKPLLCLLCLHYDVYRGIARRLEVRVYGRTPLNWQRRFVPHFANFGKARPIRILIRWIAFPVADSFQTLSRLQTLSLDAQHSLFDSCRI
jgi:hypothetical protein